MHRRPHFTFSTGLRAAIAMVVANTVFTVAACGGSNPPAVAGQSDPMAAAAPLLKSVSSAVPGLSQAQAILGLGSLMGLAKAKMPVNDFNQASSALPGGEVLLNEATKQGLPSTLGSLADVSAFVGKSGISPTQVNQMVPALGSALSGKVSPSLASSFLSALK